MVDESTTTRDLLARWQAAQRDLRATVPGTPEYEDANRAWIDARDAYHRHLAREAELTRLTRPGRER
jgi:hypothetical protein